MVKKLVAILLVLVVIAVAVFKIFFDKGGVGETLSNVERNLKSYHLEANMEMINGDDSRNFLVKVTYKDSDGKDFYRVSLLDRSINQEQLIIRNENGVYVLTPALNQVYQFKGDWPNNSPKPYIYRSLLDSVKGEHELRTMDDGYLVTSSPKYQNATSWVKQEVKFSKNLAPLWVHIYDGNGALKVKVTFSKFELNPTIDDQIFNVQTNMETARENAGEITAKLEDLPLFPIGADINATLKDQTQATINGSIVHILSYDGNKPFTVVQRLLTASDETVTKEVKGVMCDLIDGVGFFENKTLTYVYNGVEYKILSEVLSVSELIDIANGMEVVATK
jgi:outer membrane lipoprotein-sorting protein